MNKIEFDKATAEAIRDLADFPEALEVCDDGLYVAETFKDRTIGVAALPSRIAGSVIFDWTPVEDMDWPDAPNPATAPALPIPFTAADLAAFMLDGAGRSIQDRFGRLGDPLDAQVLAGLNPKERWHRQALEGAYRLAEAAQAVVGRFDFDGQRAAHALAREADDAEAAANDYERVFEDGITSDEACARRERAKASVAPQVGRADAAVRESEANWVVYRKAMVGELLDPNPVRRMLKRQDSLRRSNPELVTKFKRADALFEKLCEIKAAGLDYQQRQDLAKPFWEDLVELEYQFAERSGNGEVLREKIEGELRERLGRLPGDGLGSFLQPGAGANGNCDSLDEIQKRQEHKGQPREASKVGRGNHALTAQQIVEAQAMRKRGEKLTRIAATLGVSPATISRATKKAKPTTPAWPRPQESIPSKRVHRIQR